MKISKSRKLWTLYKKDLAASKFESLLILGFILVGNLFLYYKAKTSWPSDISLVFSMIISGFIPLFTFLKAFNFIRSEWKENTVYWIMSLPTSGNNIFLAKFMALLSQFFVLGIIALAFTLSFIFMKTELQDILRNLKEFIDYSQVGLEAIKIGVIMFLGFGMTIIIAFFSAVVGKLFDKFSGLITFLVFIFTNYITSRLLMKLIELTSRVRLDSYMQERILADGTIISWQLIPNQIFISSLVLTILISALIFLTTTSIYDRRVEL